MKMKKIICSLMISVLCFMTAISGVSAANTYDVNKILDAAEKVQAYYKENGLSESNYFDDIIAYEALGGEAENDFDVSGFENKIYVGYLGSMAKGIIIAKLLGKDPTQLTINGSTVNLVKQLEAMVNENGCFGAEEGNNNEIWGLLALEAVSSSKTDLVANHIATDINNDGGFWNYGFKQLDPSDKNSPWVTDTSVKYSSCDVTGWGIEALSIAGKEKYASTIQKAIQYLKDNQGDEAGFLSYGKANTDTQACVVEGLSVYNRFSLLNGDYNKNDKNPIDVLLAFQNTDKGTFWYSEAGEDNGYATQDAARAVGTVLNGSVIYKAKGSGNPDYKIVREEHKTEPTTPVEPKKDATSTQTTTPAQTDKKATAVKTGDDTNIVVYVSLSMMSAGLFLVLKKEYERAH